MFDLPVTVIAGYLGSGKTRYINQRLNSANGVRYAVLVNDFGELEIDVNLIQSRNTTSISLVNGCVCCSFANDMDKALEEVSSMQHNLDWVLLEASGVADSARTKQRVLNWPGYKLDKVITLVDVSRIRRLVADKYVGQHVLRQLAVADEILLSKTDLVSLDEVRDTQAWIREKSEKVSVEYAGTQRHPEFYTDSLITSEPVSRSALESWLDELDDSVIRVKGFVYLSDDPDHEYLVQRVEQQCSIERLATWTGRPETGLVLISTHPIQTRYPDSVQTGSSVSGDGMLESTIRRPGLSPVREIDGTMSRRSPKTLR